MKYWVSDEIASVEEYLHYPWIIILKGSELLVRNVAVAHFKVTWKEPRVEEFNIPKLTLLHNNALRIVVIAGVEQSPS